MLLCRVFFAEKVFFEALNHLNQLSRSIRFVVVEGDQGICQKRRIYPEGASEVTQEVFSPLVSSCTPHHPTMPKLCVYIYRNKFHLPNSQQAKLDQNCRVCFFLLFCLWGTCGFQQWWDCSGCSIYLAAISVKSDLKSFSTFSHFTQKCLSLRSCSSNLSPSIHPPSYSSLPPCPWNQAWSFSSTPWIIISVAAHVSTFTKAMRSWLFGSMKMKARA